MGRRFFGFGAIKKEKHLNSEEIRCFYGGWQ